MSSQKENNAVVIAKCNKRLTAIPKYVHAKTEIAANGTHFNAGALTAIFQACLDTRAAVDAKRAELKAALVEMQRADQARRAVDKSLRHWVAEEFGYVSQAVHEFGYSVPKAPTMTVAERNAAITQAQATRLARKQALAQVGQVAKTGATLAPPAMGAPAEPAINVVAPAATTNGLTNGVAHH